MSDPALHFEPFLYLAGLTHDDALIAWGGFWFRDPDRDDDAWGIVEDQDLDELREADGRRGTIGASSPPIGDAEVEVVELQTGEVAARARTSEANHVWVRGLRPDTAYRYRVTIDGEPWAEGPRRDWVEDSTEAGRDLEPRNREYDTRFRTFPAPDVVAPARFAVIGDYGTGILAARGNGDRQWRLANALERAVDHAGVRFVVTTGDNVYIGEEDTVAGTGDADDDWYFSFYAPYRYTISRVPVYPGIGNHDASESESADNRDELADNLFTDIRFAEEAEVARASVDPGLYYRFRFGADLELVAIDTTEASDESTEHYYELPQHRDFLEEAFPPAKERPDHPRWRIPFSHHPPYCAGPHHGNDAGLLEHVVPLLRRADVRLMLSGHEHNFQHAQVDGIDYLVCGASGKLREEPPTGFDEAGTVRWAAEGHLLIVDVDEDAITIHPVTDVDDEGRLTYLQAQHPDGSPAKMPIVVER